MNANLAAKAFDPVKSVGLHWREGKLLAAEITTDSGHIKGVRPLGGKVEFGETVQSAVIREFKDELNISVEIASPPRFIENIYTHENRLGHEIIALIDVTFDASSFPDRFSFREDNGSIWSASWFDLDELDTESGPELFPTGLKSLL